MTRGQPLWNGFEISITTDQVSHFLCSACRIHLLKIRIFGICSETMCVPKQWCSSLARTSFSEISTHRKCTIKVILIDSRFTNMHRGKCPTWDRQKWTMCSYRVSACFQYSLRLIQPTSILKYLQIYWTALFEVGREFSIPYIRYGLLFFTICKRTVIDMFIVFFCSFSFLSR